MTLLGMERRGTLRATIRRRKKRGRESQKEEKAPSPPPLSIVNTIEDRPVEGKWYRETQRWALSSASAATQKNRTVALCRLDAFLLSVDVNLGDEQVIHVSTPNVKAYYERLRSAYSSRPSTWKQYVRRLKGLFIFLEMPHLHVKLPAKTRDKDLIVVRSGPKVTPEEMNKMWDRATKTRSYRERALLSLLYVFRMTMDEILTLRAKDVRFDDERVYVREGAFLRVWNGDGSANRYAKALYRQRLFHDDKDDEEGEAFFMEGGGLSKRSLYRMLKKVSSGVRAKDCNGGKILPRDFLSKSI